MLQGAVLAGQFAPSLAMMSADVHAFSACAWRARPALAARARPAATHPADAVAPVVLGHAPAHVEHHAVQMEAVLVRSGNRAVDQVMPHAHDAEAGVTTAFRHTPGPRGPEGPILTHDEVGEATAVDGPGTGQVKALPHQVVAVTSRVARLGVPNLEIVSR